MHTRPHYIKGLALLLLSMSGLSPTIPAKTQVIYTYTGVNWSNYYYGPYNGDPRIPSPADHLTFTMNFAQALPANMALTAISPDTWTMSDGVYSYLDPPPSNPFVVATDSQGVPLQWRLFVLPYPSTILGTINGVFNVADDTTANNSLASGIPNAPTFDVSTSQQIGAWSVQNVSAVPEPSGMALLSLSTFSIGLYATKRKRQRDLAA